MVGRRFGQCCDHSFALAGILEVFLQITVVGLDFAFGFFETTLGLILVHGVLLRMILIEGSSAENAIRHLERLGRALPVVCALPPIANGPGKCSAADSDDKG